MNEDVDYDPWDDALDEIDPAEIREMLYESGIKSFPLDVLKKMWLRELRDVGLSKVEAPTGIPPKAESHQVDRTSPPLQGDVRQVRLGTSRSPKRPILGVLGSKTCRKTITDPKNEKHRGKDQETGEG